MSSPIKRPSLKQARDAISRVQYLEEQILIFKHEITDLNHQLLTKKGTPIFVSICPWCPHTILNDKWGMEMQYHYGKEHDDELKKLKKMINKEEKPILPTGEQVDQLFDRVNEHQILQETKSYSSTTYSEFDIFFDVFIKECQGMQATKGREYAGANDRFDNFNRQSKKNAVDRLVVANIYLGKHLDAIDNFIREGKIYSNEGIRGRIIDAVTYLILIAGMIELNNKK